MMEITPAEATNLGWTIVDVRSASERAAAQVAGSLHTNPMLIKTLKTRYTSCSPHLMTPSVAKTKILDRCSSAAPCARTSSRQHANPGNRHFLPLESNRSYVLSGGLARDRQETETCNRHLLPSKVRLYAESSRMHPGFGPPVTVAGSLRGPYSSAGGSLSC